MSTAITRPGHVAPRCAIRAHHEDASTRHGPPGHVVPTGSDDLHLFLDHLRRTETFSERLAEVRCRHTGHFDRHLRDTLGVLAPLMTAWTSEILFVLHLHGPSRFNHLLRTLDPVSPRVLTDKLRHLEGHGHVQRITADQHVAYALTTHGTRTTRLLHPLLYYLRNQDAIDARNTVDAAGGSADRTFIDP